MTPPFAHRTNVPLAPLTTFGIGGPANLFTEPATPDELATAVTWAKESGTPWFVLGTGANILVGDGGFRGLVVHNKVSGIEYKDTCVTAGSGATIAELITESTRRGLSGFEHYIKIPSSVGGALWQNLHFLSPDRSRTMFIEEILESADILTEAGERKQVDRAYFEFGYDDSVLHHQRDIVLTATFQLEPEDQDKILQVADANAAWRTEKHPPGAERMSAGSIFQKIDDVGAGRLIDQAGLKGCSIGGAQVSDRHANYILNIGGATAADVRALIAHIQREVKSTSGHELMPEIGFIGEFG